MEGFQGIDGPKWSETRHKGRDDVRNKPEGGLPDERPEEVSIEGLRTGVEPKGKRSAGRPEVDAEQMELAK